MSSNSEPEDEEVNMSSDSESEETRRSRLYLRLLLGPLPKSLMPLVPSREVYLRWVSHLLLVNHLMIDGLASWALRGDLEASRARAREMETNEENATLRKKLVETEMKLELARMKREAAEKRLHESRVWNKRFYLDMVLIGAVSKTLIEENTERLRKILKKSSSSGTKKPSESHGSPSDS
ncbi:hypothetical protein Tco_0375738 [Tanacetum coccineum]